jgi:hypothetical protein
MKSDHIGNLPLLCPRRPIQVTSLGGNTRGKGCVQWHAAFQTTHLHPPNEARASPRGSEVNNTAWKSWATSWAHKENIDWCLWILAERTLFPLFFHCCLRLEKSTRQGEEGRTINVRMYEAGEERERKRERERETLVFWVSSKQYC